MSDTIPTAKGLPLIGSLLQLMRNPLTALMVMTQENGSMFFVKILHKKLLVMGGVDVNRFLSEEGKDCIISEEQWKDLRAYWQCPHMLIAMDGQPHIEERRQWKRYISREVAHGEQDKLFDVIRQFMDEHGQESSVSVNPFCRSLITRELSYLFTGEIFQLPPDLADSIGEYLKMLLVVKLNKSLPAFVLRLPFFRRHEKRVQAFGAELLRRARTKLDEDSLFSMAIKRVDADPSLSEAELLPILLTPFIAGLDTLASSLTFLLQELLNNPALLTRVRDEIDAACAANNGQLPLPENMRTIPALFAACQETLRRYPVAFGTLRHAATDFEYQGKKVAKGQQIMFFTGAPHFDARYFPNPDQFDIDRFLEPRMEQRTRYAFSPYGRGPHICLGAALAESIFLSTTACLLRHYEFSAVEPNKRYPMIFNPGPCLPNRFRMRISRRFLDSPNVSALNPQQVEIFNPSSNIHT
ncbi:MAG TPA: cytochrome P450 [Pseudomonadales bacterium]|nr:cytochrome P450 [Pseudomonadales bacterium]